MKVMKNTIQVDIMDGIADIIIQVMDIISMIAAVVIIAGAIVIAAFGRRAAHIIGTVTAPIQTGVISIATGI